MEPDSLWVLRSVLISNHILHFGIFPLVKRITGSTRYWVLNYIADFVETHLRREIYYTFTYHGGKTLSMHWVKSKSLLLQLSKGINQWFWTIHLCIFCGITHITCGLLSRHFECYHTIAQGFNAKIVTKFLLHHNFWGNT